MPQALVALLPYIIPAAATAGTAIYETRAQGDMQQQAMNAQRQQQQQQQQQLMSQRRQQAMAAAPGLQSQTSGMLPSAAFQGQLAAVTGNPNFGLEGLPPAGGGEGSLTPAMENLFPSGGVPSLTEPWPTNV